FLYGDPPLSLASAEYVCSHGITPGVALLKALPGRTPPPTGDLIITDTQNGTIRIPDCRLSNLQSEGPAGPWNVYIEDRRWRWRFGYISLVCNQYDDSNRTLLPGSIMSAQEIAVLCLTAMNEVGYTISGLPPGLTTAQRTQLVPFLPVGLRFPPDSTGGNPQISWSSRNPAEA